MQNIENDVSYTFHLFDFSNKATKLHNLKLACTLKNGIKVKGRVKQLRNCSYRLYGLQCDIKLLDWVNHCEVGR